MSLQLHVPFSHNLLLPPVKRTRFTYHVLFLPRNYKRYLLTISHRDAVHKISGERRLIELTNWPIS